VKHANRKRWIHYVGALALAAVLGACGGGGGGGEETAAAPVAPLAPGAPVTPPTPETPVTPVTPPAPPAPAATPTLAGLYFGTTTAAGGTFDALILASGRMYGMQGANGGINNVFFGNGTVAANGYASTTGSTLSTSSGLTTAASSTLTGTPTTGITGTITSAAVSASFTSGYRSTFETPASLAGVTGSYGGQFAGLGPGDGFLLTLAIDAAGNLSGTTGSGCGHTGKLTPDPTVNVFEATVTLGSGCRKRGTLTGHAIYQPAAGSVPATLTIFAISGDFRDGWIYLGGKN
jgi:hypothetical protein